MGFPFPPLFRRLFRRGKPFVGVFISAVAVGNYVDRYVALVAKRRELKPKEMRQGRGDGNGAEVHC